MTGKGDAKYPNRDEGQRFVKQVLQLPKLNALFCLTLYYTGCRISEALSLRPRDLDPETKIIRIRSLKKRGRTEIRRVPVPEFLAKELLNAAVFPEDWRFWLFSRTTGWRIIKRVMTDPSISGIHATTKGLRHGFDVRGALGQIPVSLIQGWMGHADSATTAIYLAVHDEEERALIGKTW